MYLYAFLPFPGTFEKGEISESLLRHHFLVKKLFFDFVCFDKILRSWKTRD